MRPIKFPGYNHQLNKPENMTDDECQPLPCQKSQVQMSAGQVNRWTSVWELSEIDKASILRDGKICLSIFANGHPPVSLSIQEIDELIEEPINPILTPKTNPNVEN